MRKLLPEEVKKIEYKILVDVADFCERNNIKYFLAYGTLIGAVRHKGFIPWDDDIDIQMPRPDYEKFLRSYNIDNENKKYQLISPYDKKSHHSFAKVMDVETVKIEGGQLYGDEKLGIDIDIFPLDGQPEDMLEYEKWYNKKHRVYYWMGFTTANPNSTWKMRLFCPIFQLIMKKQYYQKMADAMQKKYQYDKSEFVGCTSSLFNSIKNRHRKADYDDFVLMPFEGKKFRVPVGYDRILKSIYGDYMKLPPEEQRITHHVNECFLIE